MGERNTAGRLCGSGVACWFCVLPQDWIDRVDLASQQGEAKPVFETAEGEAIFPEGDDPWWLTDVSRRQLGEDDKDEGDEDGPPSDDLEEERQGEVSDSDAESEIRVEGGSRSSAHEPFIGWQQ